MNLGALLKYLGVLVLILGKVRRLSEKRWIIWFVELFLYRKMVDLVHGGVDLLEATGPRWTDGQPSQGVWGEFACTPGEVRGRTCGEVLAGDRWREARMG